MRKARLILLATTLFAAGAAAQEPTATEPACSPEEEGCGAVGEVGPDATLAPVVVASDSSVAEDGTGRLDDEQTETEATLGVETVRRSTDPYEEPGKTYYFLGAAYWHSFTPSFVLDLFTDVATPTNNPGIGLQFTIRNGQRDLITTLYYQSFSTYGPYRGQGDPEGETEIIDSSVATLMVSESILWGTQFNDWFGIQYGFDLGIGYVFGDLYRTEAYPDAGSASGWSPCAAPGVPSGGYCDPSSVGDGETGGHYGARARSWIDGGSVPKVWLRVAPHLALRFKPIRQLMMRIDGGFDVFSGFFLGGSAAFGF